MTVFRLHWQLVLINKCLDSPCFKVEQVIVREDWWLRNHAFSSYLAVFSSRALPFWGGSLPFDMHREHGGMGIYRHNKMILMWL